MVACSPLVVVCQRAQRFKVNDLFATEYVPLARQVGPFWVPHKQYVENLTYIAFFCFGCIQMIQTWTETCQQNCEGSLRRLLSCGL